MKRQAFSGSDHRMGTTQAFRLSWVSSLKISNRIEVMKCTALRYVFHSYRIGLSKVLYFLPYSRQVFVSCLGKVLELVQTNIIKINFEYWVSYFLAHIVSMFISPTLFS